MLPVKVPSTCVRFSSSIAWRRLGRVDVRPQPELGHVHAVLVVLRDQRGEVHRGVEQLGAASSSRLRKPMRSASSAWNRRPVSMSSAAIVGPDDARQQVARADVARRQADLDEVRREERVVAGDPQVAREREREPAADRGAVHRRDHRLRAPRGSRASARRGAPVPSARVRPGRGRGRSACSSSPPAMLAPAQKPRPAPVSTTARTSRCPAARRSARLRSVTMVLDERVVAGLVVHRDDGHPGAGHLGPHQCHLRVPPSSVAGPPRYDPGDGRARPDTARAAHHHPDSAQAARPHPAGGARRGRGLPARRVPGAQRLEPAAGRLRARRRPRGPRRDGRDLPAGPRGRGRAAEGAGRGAVALPGDRRAGAHLRRR